MSKDLTRLSDSELVDSLKALVRDERGRLVHVLKHLTEMDRRRYAVNSGYPSLFDYCVRELRYAQGEAARRIHAARAAAKYPILYRTLERGLLSLTTVSLLAPHLKWDNHRKLIRDASGRNTREVEALVAALTPGPQPVERIRFISVSSKTSAPAVEAQKSLDDLFVATPNVPEHSPNDEKPEPPQETPPAPTRRVHFSFTADETLLRDIERAKELLQYKSPTGKLEIVFAAALRSLLKDIDPERRKTATERRRRAETISRPRSRAVSRRVKDAVWARDGGRCVFTSEDGRRCATRAGLQFDHIRPWARGGVSDDPDNLRLLCRAHNALTARRAFGDAVIDAAISHRRSS